MFMISTITCKRAEPRNCKIRLNVIHCVAVHCRRSSCKLNNSFIFLINNSICIIIFLIDLVSIESDIMIIEVSYTLATYDYNKIFL